MTTPTGNAISDSHGGASDWQAIIAGVEAGLGISARSGNMLAQEAQAFGPNLDQANAQLDSVAKDCMWPPSAQVTIPIIPGIYSQSFQIPCLVTYSEARALVAVGLLVAGGLIFWGGIAILVAAEVLPPALAIAGLKSGRGGGAAKAKKAPEKKTEPEPAPETTQADVTEAA